jgi:hypothetical protein
MANPASGVSSTQQTAQVAQTSQSTPVRKQSAPNQTGAPQDTVTISAAGKTASQAQSAAQNQPAGGDPDQDGK